MEGKEWYNSLDQEFLTAIKEKPPEGKQGKKSIIIIIKLSTKPIRVMQFCTKEECQKWRVSNFVFFILGLRPLDSMIIIKAITSKKLVPKIEIKFTVYTVHRYTVYLST